MDISQEWRQRFNAKWVEDASTGCWVWQGASHVKGYGYIKIPKTRKQIPAHRLSYLIHVGDIPDGKCVLHKCDNPPCVNPDHLFIGTKLDNAMDMVKKMRHCYGERQGSHKLTEKEVVRIHEMIKLGMKQKEIAAIFKIGAMQISRIKHGSRWRHIFDKL